MFKFLRQYQQYILAVGVAVLMVAFLAQGSFSTFFGYKREQAPVGRTSDRVFTFGDQDAAASDRYVLEHLRILPPDPSQEEGLAWMLVLHDAQRLGLEVSQAEVATMLASLGMGDEVAIAKQARQINVASGNIQRAVKNLLLFEQYRQLVLGTRMIMPIEQRIQMSKAQQIRQEMNTLALKAYGAEGGKPDALVMQGLESMQREFSAKLWDVVLSPRLSRPLVEHFMSDQGAVAKVALVRVKAEDIAKDLPAPDAGAVQELFAKYKDSLPGTGKPYGFGYRRPEQVKIEYLELPMRRVLDAVTVDEADAIAYYNQNKARFTVPAKDGQGADQTLAYADVRKQILLEMRRSRARDLSVKIMNEARNLCLEETRRWPEAGGYRQIAQDWQPRPLTEVAKELQEQFHLMPDVKRLDGQWFSAREPEAMGSLGKTSIFSATREQARTPMDFGSYVMSARELEPKTDNLLTTYRLQSRMPSLTMTDDAGDMYMFRLIDARPARSPEELEEVKDQVRKDALHLAAYQKLQADASLWLAKAREGSLDKVAGEVGRRPMTSAMFRRRNVDQTGISVPFIPGLAENETFQDEKFVDAVFDRARTLALSKEGKVVPVSLAGREQRTLALPVDSKLSLYVTVIEDFVPMTRQAYDRTLTVAWELPRFLLQSMIAEPNLDPLSAQAMIARTGFVHGEGN